jgi:hypothetical protein
MIRVIGSGSYRLDETAGAFKLLMLDSYGEKCTYAWEWVNGINIRLTDRKPDEAHYTLADGKYRMYEVRDETGLTNQLHLELSLGGSTWQGYLLPEGLPEGAKTKTMRPVKELITKSFASARFPVG